jgi:hypothetical protein
MGRNDLRVRSTHDLQMVRQIQTQSAQELSNANGWLEKVGQQNNVASNFFPEAGKKSTPSVEAP